MNNPNPTAEEKISGFIEDLNKMIEVYDLAISDALATFEEIPPEWSKEERLKRAMDQVIATRRAKKQTALEILKMIEKGALFLEIKRK
tara:strand:+ start:1588 stop:1851 length:264 start_codon:yes stop_codon:yes gene_type:complete